MIPVTYRQTNIQTNKGTNKDEILETKYREKKYDVALKHDPGNKRGDRYMGVCIDKHRQGVKDKTAARNVILL